MSVLYRRPLHEVASWPAHELDVIEEFLAREPAPEQCVEIVVARLCELFSRAWLTGGTLPKVTDFLPYLDAWKKDIADDPRYSDVDREAIKAFEKG